MDVLQHVNPAPDSPPAVIASAQIAAFDIQTQRLRRLTDVECEYLAESKE
jgi:acyl-CoA thioester hydrolase